MKISLASAALVLGFSLSPALAQTSAPPASAPEFVLRQPASERLASLFIGENVVNPAGETIGNVNDLLFDDSGRITSVVLGVGGFLGLAEKNVAIPFKSLAISPGKDGERVITVAVSRSVLETAPEFQATEKSTLTIATEKAKEWGKTVSEKAGELTDKAARKLEEMRKEEPKK